MVGWYHQLDAHVFKQASGVGDGQGSLVCCSPWGFKEMDMTEQLNNNNRASNSDRLHVSILRQQGGSVEEGE